MFCDWTVQSMMIAINSTAAVKTVLYIVQVKRTIYQKQKLEKSNKMGYAVVTVSRDYRTRQALNELALRFFLLIW